jgi:hypothetical protein
MTLLIDSMNTRKTLIIIISVISISVITAMGSSSAAYNIGTNLGCEKGLSVKVFDEETVPKYLIGSDYKAMPLDH